MKYSELVCTSWGEKEIFFFSKKGIGEFIQDGQNVHLWLASYLIEQ